MKKMQFEIVTVYHIGQGDTISPGENKLYENVYTPPSGKKIVAEWCRFPGSSYLMVCNIHHDTGSLSVGFRNVTSSVANLDPTWGGICYVILQNA